MVNAFAYFDSMPEKVLTDNRKTVITGRESDKPIWNTAFKDFSVDIGFVPKMCSLRRPQTKGKVNTGHVKGNFLPDSRFEDLSDLNRQAVQWCRERGRKIHGRTGKISAEELSKESLLPLPLKEIMDTYR